MNRTRVANIFLGCLLCIAATAQTASAQRPREEQRRDDHPRTVIMMGEATVTAVPDRAIVSGGVISDAATASEALEANAKAMSQVFASLKQLGIPERAIQTTSYSLDPQHPPYNEKTGLSSKIIGYRVTNEVQIKLDDIGRAGPALDALIESGANESAGVGFSIKDPKTLERQARNEAVRD